MKLLATVLGCSLSFFACGGDGEKTGATPGPGPVEVDAGPGDGSDAAPSGGAIGSACTCDADCPADGDHAGVCVLGVCMTRASGECSAAGSTEECGDGSRCWGLEGVEGAICWPDCDSHQCDGACDGDGSCVPTADTNCSLSCAELCSCEGNEDCADGEACIRGVCITGTGDGPGDFPGTICDDLPERDCVGDEAYCGELIAFDPRVTPHYDDYPINGETPQNQYRSYIRREHAMLLDWATAKTLCQTQDWEIGIGGALGFGDMSEANGAIPGTAVGSPGHPQGTHVGGNDIDLAYYQIGTPNNYLRPICEHVVDGQDQYRCVEEPYLLDLWRTALFLGYIFESPLTRVIGVDGQAGAMLSAAITELCATGWINSDGCNLAAQRLAYEVTNQGLGWYNFHHHHAHISTCDGSCSNLLEGPPATMTCKSPGCGVEPALKENPHRFRGLKGGTGSPPPGI